MAGPGQSEPFFLIYQYDDVMTDLSLMREEDVTCWPEDSNAEWLAGEPADEEFEGEDEDAQSV